MTDIIKVSDAMKELGIQRITYRPADELISSDRYSVNLLDGWLAYHIGSGATVEEALADAVSKVRGREAA